MLLLLLLLMLACILMREKIKDVHLDGWRSVEDVGGVGKKSEYTVENMYFQKNIQH